MLLKKLILMYTQKEKEKQVIKDMQLKMRVSKAEKELYSSEAKKRGMSLSDFVRYSIKKELNSINEKRGRKK